VEFLGVDLVGVQPILLTVTMLLSVGWLVALGRKMHAWGSPRPIILLQPAPTPERLPASSGGPRRRSPAGLLTRAPPVPIAQRLVFLDPSVE